MEEAGTLQLEPQIQHKNLLFYCFTVETFLVFYFCI